MRPARRRGRTSCPRGGVVVSGLSRLSQLEAAAIPAHVDRDIPPIHPASVRKRDAERLDPAETFGIVLGNGHHQADAFLRTGRRLRHGDATAEKRSRANERGKGRGKLAPIHGALHNESGSWDCYDTSTG